jgi:diguanylate cyclase (GGDEF)-like protein/PAS domain S-box-containing protein
MRAGPGLPSEILLVVSDDDAAESIREALLNTDHGTFTIKRVRRLEEGLREIRQQTASAVVLSLTLPDSEGIPTLKKVLAQARTIPILVLGEIHQEDLAVEAFEHGANDYLMPGHLDHYTVTRSLRNAMERRAIDHALFAERDRALVTLNSIGDAVLSTDLRGNINFLNDSAEKLTGWGREEALGKPLTEVFHLVDDVTREVLPDPLRLEVLKDRPVRFSANSVLIRRDGVEAPIEESAALVHDRGGSVIGSVIVCHDVSEARAVRTQMLHSAHHDIVTALPNRLLLSDRITEAITRADRDRRPFALLFIDLDHFKAVNDARGHGVGDKLLKAVAERLKSVVRPSDTVSRQGGDEFVVLLPDILTPADAGKGAEKLLRKLRAAHSIGGETVQINASIGISMYPTDGGDAETLLHNADMAMYSAKGSNRNNYQFFTPDLAQQALGLRDLESDLRRAVLQDEFVVYYQPKVNLDSGKVVGAEALIRWQHPERGLLYPGQFISAAEDSGTIIAIDRWVLREACRQTREWQAAGSKDLTIAVNISAIAFRDDDFVANVRSILEETRYDPHQLQLELTESVLIRNIESSKDVLRSLSQMGIRLAVDDFGKGYSSLGYLRQFPINVLKIDRSFISYIPNDERDALLVSAIIAMGRSLNYVVIAEGIETEEQRTFLRGELCQEGQGFFFGKALSATAFGGLLSQPTQSV